MPVSQTGLKQGWRRTSSRRGSGLGSAIIEVEVALGLLDDGMVAGVAEGFEGDLEVDHRGKMAPRPSVVSARTRSRGPGLGEFDRLLAQMGMRPTFCTALRAQ